jgi:beta-lactamase class A
MTRHRIAASALVLAAACQVVEIRSHPPTRADLRATIEARLDSLPARTSFYAKNLATGMEITIRADIPMNTASVIKLPVMVLAYRDAEAGRLALDARHAILPEEQRRGSGLLQTFAPGLQPTMRDIVTQMIITSDNTATDIMIAAVGPDRVNRLLDSLGYRQTYLRTTTGNLFRWVWEMADSANATMTDRQVFERGFASDTGSAARVFRLAEDSSRWLGRTTAREMARLLEQLERGELAGKASTDEMRDILRTQFYSSRLPQRLQFVVPIGHKTGDIPPVLGNDVGIIYGQNGPIVIAVFTNQNRGDFFAVEATIGNVAKDVFDAWGRKP